MKNLTITEMKARNEEAGNNWFSKGAMRFFNTIIEAKPNVKDIFITSDRMETSMPKRYTLRRFDRETNTVETISEFQEFASLDAARNARNKY